MGDLPFETELALRAHDHDGRYLAAEAGAALAARVEALERRVLALEKPGNKK